MATVSENMRKISNIRSCRHLSETIWWDEERGMRKKIIHLDYSSMEKPSMLSKCHILISQIENPHGYESNYLKEAESVIEIGYPTTVVDYFIEEFLKQMLVGEKSHCSIVPRSGPETSFILELKLNHSECPWFKLTVKEIYEHAKKTKEAGVVMFKNCRPIAQVLFNHAAKCLLSFAPFEALTIKTEEIDGEELQQLLDNIYTNIAACLLKEKRYDDVIDLLKNIAERSDQQPLPEKAIYRLALAHFYIKQYDEAKAQIERLDYKENATFRNLHTDILTEINAYKTNYSSMVKKMFA